MCGRVVGYQYTSPDVIDTVNGTGHNNISSHYIDGVSLTHGSPRQHIWTFMCGLIVLNLYLDGGKGNCRCSQGSNYNFDLQSFVGNDYFCESGDQDHSGQFKWVTSTQLILYGTVKTVVLLNKHVVKLLDSHSSTRFLTIPLMTTLR